MDTFKQDSSSLRRTEVCHVFLIRAMTCYLLWLKITISYKFNGWHQNKTTPKFCPICGSIGAQLQPPTKPQGLWREASRPIPSRIATWTCWSGRLSGEWYIELPYIFLCLKTWYTHQNKGKWWLTSGVGGTPFSDKPTCCHMFLPIFLVDEWVSACILTNWRSWFLVKSAKPMKDEQRFYGYFSIRDEDTSPKIRHNTAHGKFAFRFGTCVGLSSPDLAKWQATSWHIDTLW